ncbi:hypothetical protein SAMN02910323_1561 [Selenomonas ruminantium]|uniref:DUF535 domain-containing protein n=2 Tax=Selenomonas ruminantium TaxID=971 RepID=A0A1K1NQ86_SELRU|nr:VirK/YbjX family protein [Selenomonas ruminantium]SFW37468.1 hypothetical protein SAMN02910323_1561 [Selenomonas ruminantium]
MLNFYEIGRQMYRLNNWREVHRLLVFICRSYLRYPKMKELHEFFLQNDLRREIYGYNKFPMEQVTRAFFFKGSTLAQRVDLTKYHFSYLEDKLKMDVLNDIYHYKTIRLWKSLDDDIDWYTILRYHPGQRKEGLLALEMRLDERSLYQMMFWINKDPNNEPALWIGAMQGPNTGNAKDFVKEATKRSYRYRTKNLILYMTMALARSLEVKHIYAVSNDGYYAMNHVRRDRKLKTDFGAFWEEVGGHVTDDPRFYEVPLVESRKTMEEVPTRKRAVYRKRFAFQDDVDRQIEENMRNIMQTK